MVVIQSGDTAAAAAAAGPDGSEKKVLFLREVVVMPGVLCSAGNLMDPKTTRGHEGAPITLFTSYRKCLYSTAYTCEIIGM